MNENEPDILEALQAQTLMLARLYDVLIAQMVLESMPTGSYDLDQKRQAVVERLYAAHAAGSIGNPELFIDPKNVMDQ